MTRKEKRSRKHYKRLMSDVWERKMTLNRKRRNKLARLGKRYYGPAWPDVRRVYGL